MNVELLDSSLDHVRTIIMSSSYCSCNGAPQKHRNFYCSRVCRGCIESGDIVKASLILEIDALGNSSFDSTANNTGRAFQSFATTTSDQTRKCERLKNDKTEREKLLKIGLCLSFPNIYECKFGSKCNYAHSYEEMSLNTLVARHVEGLIDMETYRTRPCFDYVATGDW